MKSIKWLDKNFELMILAIILVISVALRDMELHKLQETRTAVTPVDREEDFFA